MSYALYRCGDDTYVAVDDTTSPPVCATDAYGLPMRVRAMPRATGDSPAWRRAASSIAESMFVVIDVAEAEEMFVLR
ncbi:hypothetical protein E2F46_15220 [Luteimonas aestuarii]|uniref:Uncharacterized protein n=1 Tax=Luteimonas aestuarii TaxID=453837 RepID=A0A4R5TNA7_9GAMM|nr:hypothetical protein [Luteimonas aestuarii]TDK21048.1 hypothetical protein E2F46_15220 [Luteimonas aestuarii]